MQSVLVLFASILAGFTQTVSGFGCGIVLMLFLPMILSILRASALNVMIGLVLNLILAIQYRKHINMRLVILPALLSFVLTTIAIEVGSSLQLDLLKNVFSCFLIVLALYFMFFADRITIKPNLLSISVCSSISGIANGLFGIGGPPMVLYYLAVTKEKKEYIGTIQMFFLVNSIYSTIVRVMNHLIDIELVLLFVPGIIGVFLGEWMGMKVVDKIPQKQFKQMIYLFLIVSGLLTLL
ncbi:MAG: sulfite exporter TauE/SafE family protein [Erysipelotrichaceae bacterium]|nr:sulfite exporter TauE/SafE family protein [Erysipelotrichaceae bacterium]